MNSWTRQVTPQCNPPPMQCTSSPEVRPEVLPENWKSKASGIKRNIRPPDLNGRKNWEERKKKHKTKNAGNNFKAQKSIFKLYFNCMSLFPSYLPDRKKSSELRPDGMKYWEWLLRKRKLFPLPTRNWWQWIIIAIHEANFNGQLTLGKQCLMSD